MIEVSKALVAALADHFANRVVKETGIHNHAGVAMALEELLKDDQDLYTVYDALEVLYERLDISGMPWNDKEWFI